MSTFELFLQLPLFEGVDREELFSLIPKINLDFESFQPGEIVFDRQMEAKGLVYLLRGEVKVKAKGEEQIMKAPVLLSFSGLFGDSRQFVTDVTAIDSCSILNIEAKSLLFLLRNSPAFLSKYLDLLSNTIDALYLKSNDFIIV